jgi:hypothetical protein
MDIEARAAERFAQCADDIQSLKNRQMEITLISVAGMGALYGFREKGAMPQSVLVVILTLILLVSFMHIIGLYWVIVSRRKTQDRYAALIPVENDADRTAMGTLFNLTGSPLKTNLNHYRGWQSALWLLAVVAVAYGTCLWALLNEPARRISNG